VSKGVISALELVGAVVLAVYGQYQLAASLAAAALGTEHAARAEIAARNAYNASLRDRYAMVRSSTAARQLVFGRCRVSGPIFFGASYGNDNQHLTICVALAAHEVDAIETIYFDDKPVVLDGAGNVLAVQEHDSFSITTATKTVTIQKTPQGGSVTATARYGDVIVNLTVTSVSGVNVSVSGATAGAVGQLDVYYQPNPDPYSSASVTHRSAVFSVTSTTQTFTLPSVGPRTPISAPDSTGVIVAYQVTGASSDNSLPVTGVTVSGYNVTISGLAVGRSVVIYYQTGNATNSKARVRKYLGTGAQTADAAMIANFPGTWTANHTATGIAYLVIELDYDADAFIGGVPQVSAVVRGMKCYDPRYSAASWTENPALHARALATHPLAGNLPANCINDTAVMAAANICDASASYVVGGKTYTRPLYTSGYAFAVDRKPMDGLTDLCQAMGGSWVWSDGAVLVNAGGYVFPNPGTLDETWLTDEDAVQVQVGYQRQSLVNTITATFSDKFQDYVPIPLARLAPPAYLAADGTTLSQSIQYSAVTFSGQAQYISSCLLRRMRQGTVVKLKCNYKAWQDQTFDVRNVSLARFGWVNKPFEVIQDTMTADGSIELVLQETDPSIWNMDASFVEADIAPNTSMPVPWGLPPITSLAGTSGDSTLLRQADGTAVPQISMTWDAETDSRVLVGGYIEVRYWRMGDLSTTYQTVKVQGGDSQAFLSGVRAGSDYLVTVRTASVVTQGPWCNQLVVRALGKGVPPSDVTGAADTLGNGRVHLSWTPGADTDYKLTEVRVGASWAAGTVISAKAADSFDWLQTTAGTYIVWFAHLNWSGLYSATPASLSVAVDASVNTNTFSASLSATSWVFTADASGNVSTYTGATTTMTVANAGVDDTANWTYSRTQSTGIGSNLGGTSSNVLTVTSMTASVSTGTVTITAAKAGFASIVKVFSLSKSIAGATGAPGIAVTAGLSNSSQTLPADSNGLVSSYAGASTQMTVFLNGVDDSSNWTFSKADSTGLTTTLSGTTVTVTAMADATDTAYTDVTAARAGYTSQVKRYSLTKSKSALSMTGVNSQLGSISVSGSTATPAHAQAGVQFNVDGQIYTKSGGVSGSYTASSQKWWIGAPASVPTGTGSLTLTTTLVSKGTNSAGTAIPGVTLGNGAMSSNRAVIADVGNATSGTITVNYAITNGSGNTLSQGSLYLTVDSS
jgi:hypothetical protein